MKNYIPDPAKWENYFEKVARREIAPRKSYRPGIIAIEEAEPGLQKRDLVTIKAVTQVERTVEQAISELRRQGDLRSNASQKRKREEKEGGESLVPPKRYKSSDEFNKSTRKVSSSDTSGF